MKSLLLCIGGRIIPIFLIRKRQMLCKLAIYKYFTFNFMYRFIFTFHICISCLQVKELYLDNNNLTRVERGALVNLTFLTKLYLRNNKIVSLEPYAFQNLPQLSELYMSNNLIAELHPDVFTVSRSV